jgi:GTPase SAR1 family protein
MSSIKTLIAKHDQKISIALVGLAGAGKTTLVKRMLQNDELIQATSGSASNFALHVFGNLTLYTWDLKDQIPSNDILWSRSILGADIIFFVVDATNRELFSLNKKLIFELVNQCMPIRLLVLGSKADSPHAASVGELINSLNLIEIDQKICKCDLFKFSSNTGEGMYAVEEWLNRVVFKQKERIIDYVRIAACIVYNTETFDFLDVIITQNPNINLLTTIRELKRKLQIFAHTMKMHRTGEEIMEISNFKVVLVKEQYLTIAVIVQRNDSIPRTINIAQNIMKIISTYHHRVTDLKKIVTDLYPLDIA